MKSLNEIPLTVHFVGLAILWIVALASLGYRKHRKLMKEMREKADKSKAASYAHRPPPVETTVFRRGWPND